MHMAAGVARITKEMIPFHEIVPLTHKNWKFTVNNPRLFSISMIAALFVTYIQSARSGSSSGRTVLFVNLSKISFNRNPDVNFCSSVVFVNDCAKKMLIFCKLDGSFNKCSAQASNLRFNLLK